MCYKKYFHILLTHFSRVSLLSLVFPTTLRKKTGGYIFFFFLVLVEKLCLFLLREAQFQKFPPLVQYLRFLQKHCRLVCLENMKCVHCTSHTFFNILSIVRRLENKWK